MNEPTQFPVLVPAGRTSKTDVLTDGCEGRFFYHGMTTTLANFILNQEPNGYFLVDATLEKLIEIDRLAQVLVRCGGCRFICSAQDVAAMEKNITAGGDYVRDVSFLATDVEKAKSTVPVPMARTLVAIARKAPRFNEFDCSGSFDGNSVHSDTEWDAPGF